MGHGVLISYNVRHIHSGSSAACLDNDLQAEPSHTLYPSVRPYVARWRFQSPPPARFGSIAIWSSPSAVRGPLRDTCGKRLVPRLLGFVGDTLLIIEYHQLDPKHRHNAMLEQPPLLTLDLPPKYSSSSPLHSRSH